MRVVEVDPFERFTGLDDQGQLLVENKWRCPKCPQSITFPLGALGTRAERWQKHGPEEPELDELPSLSFAPVIQRWIAEGEARFSVELHCACNRPTAIIFEVRDNKMGLERFRPLVVLEPNYG